MKGGNPDTKRAMDMINCDADDGHLMIHSTKQYPNEEATSFHVSSKVSYFYVCRIFTRKKRSIWCIHKKKRGQFDADRKCHMNFFHQVIWCQHYVCIKMFWRIHICWKRQLLSSIKRTWLKLLMFLTKCGLEKIFLKFLHAAAIFYQMNLPHRNEEFWSKVQIQ